jgi:hypothetical protein
VSAPGGPSASAAPEPAGPRGGRGRWVLTLLLLSGLVALTALPAWIRAVGTSPVTGEVAVDVRGTVAAPGLVAAALVLLAAAGALGLVGRVGRWVVVVVVAAAGALVTASALGARSGSEAVATRAVAEATGVSSLTGSVQVAAWPWVAAALGVLVLLAAVGLARASGRWAAPSDRHERRPGAPAPAATPARGTAPGDARRTSTEGTPGASSATTRGTAAPEAADERGTWDALSRGDDPT